MLWDAGLTLCGGLSYLRFAGKGLNLSTEHHETAAVSQRSAYAAIMPCVPCHHHHHLSRLCQLISTAL